MNGARNLNSARPRSRMCGKLSNRAPISSTLRWTASRTAAGRESNALENVSDQIWSTAATASFRLARRVLAGRNFAARLVELGFYFIGQFKPVFKIVVNPVADFFDFRARQIRNRSLNFFDCAHGEKLPDGCWFEKPCLRHLRHPFMPCRRQRMNVGEPNLTGLRSFPIVCTPKAVARRNRSMFPSLKNLSLVTSAATGHKVFPRPPLIRSGSNGLERTLASLTN